MVWRYAYVLRDILMHKAPNVAAALPILLEIGSSPVREISDLRVKSRLLWRRLFSYLLLATLNLRVIIVPVILKSLLFGRIGRSCKLTFNFLPVAQTFLVPIDGLVIVRSKLLLPLLQPERVDLLCIIHGWISSGAIDATFLVIPRGNADHWPPDTA